jgi:hypothetical protein
MLPYFSALPVSVYATAISCSSSDANIAVGCEYMSERLECNAKLLDRTTKELHKSFHKVFDCMHAGCTRTNDECGQTCTRTCGTSLVFNVTHAEVSYRRILENTKRKRSRHLRSNLPSRRDSHGHLHLIQFKYASPASPTTRTRC